MKNTWIFKKNNNVLRINKKKSQSFKSQIIKCLDKVSFRFLLTHHDFGQK
jgi:hypothetical protein